MMKNNWEPRNDRCLIERLEEAPQGIVLTDADKSMLGIVRAVGPGKWVNGTWWKVRDEWQWFDGYRDDWGVRVGDRVLFNSKWNDMGENYQRVGYSWPDDLHLVQVADVLAIVNNG